MEVPALFVGASKLQLQDHTKAAQSLLTYADIDRGLARRLPRQLTCLSRTGRESVPAQDISRQR